MRKALLVVLILSSALAWAQGGCRDKELNGQTTGGFLKAVGSASIRVCTDSASPCTLAPHIYSDAALQNEISNPISLDGSGNYHYCAPVGAYNEQISGAAFSTLNNTPISIAPYDAVSKSASNNFTGENHFAAGLNYDVKAYGAKGDGVTNDDAAVSSAAAVAFAGFASSQCAGIAFPVGTFRLHEHDFSSYGAACTYVYALHPGETTIVYDGLGGAGSYIFKFAGMSFGGSYGIRYDGYNSTGSTIAESAIINGPGTWDAMAIMDRNQFMHFSGNAIRNTGLFTNIWMRGNRWDTILGYPIELQSNNTGSGNPIHIQDWTYDNNVVAGPFATLAQSLGLYDGSHAGLGFVFCNNCGGARFDISDGRIEHNKPLVNTGNADNGAVLYEQGATSTLTVAMNNITVQGNSASKVAAVSAATTKVNVSANKSDFTVGVLGLLKNRATNTIVGTRLDGMGALASAGVNPQQSRGIQIEDQRIENLANAFITTNVQRWNAGDWNIRPGGDLTTTNGPIRIVTAPSPGYCFSTAISVSTTATIVSGSAVVSNLDPQNLDIKVNDNLVVNSVAVLVTAVDYVAKTFTMNSNAGASLTGSATVTRAACTFTDYAAPLTTFSGAAFTPAVANTSALGNASIPWTGIQIGTGGAARSNVTSLATAARAVSLPDLGGTLTMNIASGAVAMGTGAIAAGTCATAVTVASASVLATDSIRWSFNAAPGTGYTAGLHVLPYVTAGNVNFLVCNPTAGSLTPAAATLNWKVTR